MSSELPEASEYNQIFLYKISARTFFKTTNLFPIYGKTHVPAVNLSGKLPEALCNLNFHRRNYLSRWTFR